MEVEQQVIFARHIYVFTSVIATDISDRGSDAHCYQEKGEQFSLGVVRRSWRCRIGYCGDGGGSQLIIV